MTHHRLLTAATSLVLLNLVAAGHYYRFEAPDPAADAAGEATLAEAPATTEELGSIPSTVPATGEANAAAATGPAATDPRPGVVKDDESLTVEAFVRTPGPEATAGQFIIAEQWAGRDNQTFRFGLQPSGDGPGGDTAEGQTHRLMLVLAQRSGHVFRTNSDLNGANDDDIALEPGTDYYVAVVFDNDADEATFHATPLPDGPTQTKTVSFGIGNFKEDGSGVVDAPLGIGGSEAEGTAFAGVLDEVRVSPEALADDALLVAGE